jgi:hypothetical protein
VANDRDRGDLLFTIRLCSHSVVAALGTKALLLTPGTLPKYIVLLEAPFAGPSEALSLMEPLNEVLKAVEFRSA